ncbi:putative integral membrane protein [Minicystis rosea]|nr:putative integral membrane protein [Minicystis rosea]
MPPRRKKKPRRADEALIPLGARLARALRGPRSDRGSGPAVARLFHRLLALVFLVAWISLGLQVDVLAGTRGLVPAALQIQALRSQDISFLRAPTLFLQLGASDRVLHGGIAAGVVLALLAFAGIAPRVAIAAGTALYLSFAVVCRPFMAFQWDNLLLECGLVAVLLPRDRRAPWAHFLVRALLFKLYWESGVAKWQSPLHDWHDGSAMTFYYETAPIPARLAWHAHHLPAWWHAFEGWFTLFFELVAPLAIFAPPRPRLAALAIFTLFQIVNLATANYGFFCYLALALHLSLLDDRDVVTARIHLTRRAPWIRRLRARERWLSIRIHRLVARAWSLAPSIPAPRARAIRWAAAAAAVMAYLGFSTVEALMHFSGSPALTRDLAPLQERFAPFRLINTYHLFAAITRERIEPEIQVQTEDGFRTFDLFHKPGDPRRAPHLVAPHQPRVDFQLWFYGLGFRRGAPPYINALLDRVCHDPAAVQTLFREHLPDRPASVRLAFMRYTFTSPAERRNTGAWWKREPVTTLKPVPCGR